MCPQKANLCKRSLSWNQEQTSHPSIVVDRDWRGLASLLLVMRAKKEWHRFYGQVLHYRQEKWDMLAPFLPHPK